MVAARRLRKSMLKDMPNIDIDNITNISENKHTKNKLERFKDNIDEDIYLKDNLGTFEDVEPKLKLKTKYIIKIFFCIFIIFSCLIVKLFFKEQALSNKYIGYLIHEYNKDYTKVGVIEKIEDITNNCYEKLKYVIPESLAMKVKEKYIYNVKPELVDFEVKDVLNKLFTTTNKIDDTSSNNKNKEISENTGVGGGDIAIQTMEIPSEEESAIRERIFKILDKKIDIKKPVEGTLTSKYGEREKIFEELSKYHTGLDIANKLGTEIKSATKGKVVKVEENNKYYGNNIEIETDGVIFKYAHLNGFNVKINDEVTQDSIIGYMGSTGMSTGSHLHFEIRIDNKTVDPNEIIKFY